jgi:hypothetical protein
MFLTAIEQAGYVVDLGFGTETEEVPSTMNADRVAEAIISCWHQAKAVSGSERLEVSGRT